MRGFSGLDDRLGVPKLPFFHELLELPVLNELDLVLVFEGLHSLEKLLILNEGLFGELGVLRGRLLGKWFLGGFLLLFLVGRIGVWV